MRKAIVLLLFLFSILDFFSQEPHKFYNVQNLDVNTEYAEFGVTFYKGNQVLFASSMKDRTIKRSERGYNRMEFLQFYKGKIKKDGQIINVTRFSSEKFNIFNESDITFAKDGKTIYFTFNNYVNNKYRKNFLFSMTKKHILNIFKATISENGVVSNLSPLPFNGKNYSISHPRLSPDGKTLFFISDMEGSYGGTDIYKVSILSDGSYSTPENLGLKINTPGNEMFPFLNNDNTFYFSSDGHHGKGGLDIFSSKLVNDKFSQVENLDQLNYTDDDFAFVINEELNVGYFSSVREANKGDADIFSFNVKPIGCNQSIAGVIKNKRTGRVLANAEVQLFLNNKRIETSISNENGVYNFANICEATYTINAFKTDYVQKEKKHIASKVKGGTTEINFNLEPINCNQTIAGVVRNQKTNRVLANADVLLMKDSIVLEKIITITDGSFKFKELLDCDSKYTIIVRHVDYEPRSNEIKTDAEISKENHVNTELKKIQVDEEFISKNGVILIKTGPISFDLNKSNVIDDVAFELKKVVRIMKENPNIKVELNSHTDSRALDDYNMRLSNARAKASINYIISQGINPSRISGKGYGETRLINKCSNGIKCTNAEHEENKRTEFIVINK